MLILALNPHVQAILFGFMVMATPAAIAWAGYGLWLLGKKALRRS
jgi:hypothetical protein